MSPHGAPADNEPKDHLDEAENDGKGSEIHRLLFAKVTSNGSCFRKVVSVIRSNTGAKIRQPVGRAHRPSLVQLPGTFAHQGIRGSV